MYAISTAWNAWRAKSGQVLVDDAAKIGIANLELGFSLPNMLFGELKEITKAGKIGVVSLHNFCPLPVVNKGMNTTPDMFLVSSPDEMERQRAVRFTKQTIDSAKEIGAGCVVMHLGRVDYRYDGSRTLISLLEKGKEGTDYYKYLKGFFLLRRERLKHKYLSQAVKSLCELNDYAAQRGIKLGIENRYYLREIPSFEEIGYILERFKKSNIFYWHDVGHAQLKENLGVDNHEDYLKNYSDRMAGMHIHDIIKSDDHRAPLTGNFDFKKLIPYLKKETIKVFEPHHPATSDEIKKGFEYFRSEICPE